MALGLSTVSEMGGLLVSWDCLVMNSDGYPLFLKAWKICFSSTPFSIREEHMLLALENNVRTTAALWVREWCARYLSVWVAFRNTVVDRSPSGWCVMRESKNENFPSVLVSKVIWMDSSIELGGHGNCGLCQL